MTIHKNFKPAQRSIAQRGFLCGLALASLAGCNAFNSIIEVDRVDYKSAGKAPSLEVPPDLTQLQPDNRYAILDLNGTTASGFNAQKGVPGSIQLVALNGLGNIRVERAGDQRWLVVDQTPEVLWPKLKSFWQDSGFVISTEKPEAGVMETDWAENRAKIPQDIIRKSLGRVFDSLYSTGERDKFRTRLERGADGATEIYISHRGAEEVLVGQNKESSTWTVRPSDPSLEAEFLSRLMVRLGTTVESAKAAVANVTPQLAHSTLIKGGASGSYVELKEGFDRAWRRVGLALDRAGFTVEDRDRVQGVYFIRYIDEALAASEKNFFAKLFTTKADEEKTKAGQRYRISVKVKDATSQVTVLNGDGVAESSSTADKILSLLNDQLK